MPCKTLLKAHPAPICLRVLPIKDFDEESIDQILLTNDLASFRTFVETTSLSTFQMLRILGKAFEMDSHEIAIDFLMDGRELPSDKICRFFRRHYGIKIGITHETTANENFTPLQFYYYVCAHAGKVAGIHLLHLYGVRDQIVFGQISYLILHAAVKEYMDLMRELLRWNRYDHSSYITGFSYAISNSNLHMINLLLSYYPWMDEVSIKYSDHKSTILMGQQCRKNRPVPKDAKSKPSLGRRNELSFDASLEGRLIK